MTEDSGAGLPADTAPPPPEAPSLKRPLMAAIANEVRRRGLSQQHAAELASLKQPELSRIVNSRDSGFSTGRLIEVLCRLGYDVTIVITKVPGPMGVVRVIVPPAKNVASP